MQIPVINGMKVDLYPFPHFRIDRGVLIISLVELLKTSSNFFKWGFKNAETEKKWSEIASILNIGHASGSPSFSSQLRDIFRRFLEPYVNAAAQVLSQPF